MYESQEFFVFFTLPPPLSSSLLRPLFVSLIRVMVMQIDIRMTVGILSVCQFVNAIRVNRLPNTVFIQFAPEKIQYYNFRARQPAARNARQTVSIFFFLPSFRSISGSRLFLFRLFFFVIVFAPNLIEALKRRKEIQSTVRFIDAAHANTWSNQTPEGKKL